MGLGLADPNLTRSPGALALYGAGDVPEAMSRMEFVFRSKGVPASNNPDDIPLLQELSRRDAELHLAYAAQVTLRARAPGRVRLTKPRVRARARVSTGAASRPRGAGLR